MIPDTEAAAARLAELLRDAESDHEDDMDAGYAAGENVATWDEAEVVVMASDLRALLAERAEHLAHPAPAAVVGEVTEATKRLETVSLGIGIGEPPEVAIRSVYHAFPRPNLTFNGDIRALLLLAATPPVPPAVVPGWRMVPEEATQEMVQAALDTEQQAGRHVGNPDVRLGFFSAYRAMLASAPKPGEAK